MLQGKSISVAMCTYNGEKFLQEQLDSIAKQMRLPEELVVCDDRSTDGTLKILENFVASAPFPVTIVVNPVNLGSSAKGITRNFEQATALCRSDLVAYCDQDDVWFPQKLARLGETMEQNTQLGGVCSDAQLITDRGVPKGIRLSETTGLIPREQKRLADGQVLPVLLSMTKVYGCTLLVDAGMLKRILPVPPHWWFDAWVPCMVAIYSKLAFLPEQLFSYRIHTTQSGGASLPTAAERVKQFRSSAADYWKHSEPQLLELHERLAADKTSALEPFMAYIEGRMDLLRFRAELPSNRLIRWKKVIPQTRNYNKYFNGWKSVLKDLSA